MKNRDFHAFLFVAVATLFFPATALEKSIANAQEESYAEEEYSTADNEKENNGYYNQAYDSVSIRTLIKRKILLVL